MNIKTLATLALAGGIAVSLTACGSSGTANASSKTNSAQSGSGNGSGFGGGFRGGAPGTSGLVAALSGSTAQVQSTSSQTAVSWTSSTTFTEEVKVTKAAVKVGECVQAAHASGSSGSSGSSSTTVAAATVRITNTSGGCTAVRAGGNRPGGAPTTFPGGQNRSRPRGNFGGFATLGVVTSVSSAGFVVKPVAFGGSTSTSPVTVTTTSSTIYTQSKKASASAVKVGMCMSANGTTDSTGAVKAARITLSQPANGVCTQTRFGGGGLPGGGFQGGQGAPQNG